MASEEVTGLEDQISKILTPLAGLLTAAGGVAGVAGVLTPVVRGSERIAFVAFVFLVLGFASLVIVRLFLWAPQNVRARRRFLSFAVFSLASSMLVLFLVALTAAGRDQRPIMDVSVSPGHRTTITGSVTSGGLAFDERLAVDIRVGPDPLSSEIVVSEVTGADGTGVATVTLNSVIDVPEGAIVLVEAWLPDRSSDTPDCANIATVDVGASATSPSPTAASSTEPSATPVGLVQRINSFLPRKQAFVSCVYIQPPPFASGGPKVTLAASDDAATVTVGGPVDASGAILLRVWDQTEEGVVLLYSGLTYPDETGEASGSIKIGIGTTGALLCAVAVQGDPSTLDGTVLDRQSCRVAGSFRQGWAQLRVLPAPTPSADPVPSPMPD